MKTSTKVRLINDEQLESLVSEIKKSGYEYRLGESDINIFVADGNVEDVVKRGHDLGLGVTKMGSNPTMVTFYFYPLGRTVFLPQHGATL